MKNESGSTIDSEESEEKNEPELNAEEIVSALTSESEPPVKQKHWRWAGAVCLMVAGIMTLIAVNTDILRDSLISMAVLFSDSTSDAEPAYPFFVYVLYWGIFMLSILLAFYMVMLDLRYIRLDYALTKRKIMKESWEHEDFRKAIQAAHEKARQSEE